MCAMSRASLRGNPLWRRLATSVLTFVAPSVSMCMADDDIAARDPSQTTFALHPGRNNHLRYPPGKIPCSAPAQEPSGQGIDKGSRGVSYSSLFCCPYRAVASGASSAGAEPKLAGGSAAGAEQRGRAIPPLGPPTLQPVTRPDLHGGGNAEHLHGRMHIANDSTVRRLY
jgi:hypothetical protein